ncbi:hypothetical protein EV667_1975 [Ancylobacter aquaticus]|uniref:Uncharacterized protein n=1 Tax=Ancylobacter aquaticus TaxID=100 RepID=A0A4R1I5S0_ANCAQ|nr:hypothetical protein [Ancylobacter aquaticus]TCK27979.1 hypothetical protein EV667_1975 [Ancylobacter aquaticus]
MSLINLVPKELRLKFSVASIVWAEKALETKLASIVDELQSESGPSLRTMRALLTAGSPSDMERKMLDMSSALSSIGVYLDQRNGSRLITEYGIAACSAAVGNALGVFLASITKDVA